MPVGSWHPESCPRFRARERNGHAFDGHNICVRCKHHEPLCKDVCPVGPPRSEERFVDPNPVAYTCTSGHLTGTGTCERCRAMQAEREGRFVPSHECDPFTSGGPECHQCHEGRPAATERCGNTGCPIRVQPGLGIVAEGRRFCDEHCRDAFASNRDAFASNRDTPPTGQMRGAT